MRIPRLDRGRVTATTQLPVPRIIAQTMGIAGNNHMMFTDKSNPQDADVIQKWILDNAAKH